MPIYKYLNHSLGLTLSTPGLVVVIIIVITRVEIVLAAGGAVQQVTQLGWGQLGNLLGERISQ